jgi:catechol 2,3-dioxygenase-like lactoylglutathione lyase family enzyme
MTEEKKPRLIGINHVAIEVGNIDEALEWYGRIFDFALRGKGERNAFIDMGDQFVNLTLVPDYAVNGVEKALSYPRAAGSISTRRHQAASLP